MVGLFTTNIVAIFTTDDLSPKDTSIDTQEKLSIVSLLE